MSVDFTKNNTSNLVNKVNSSFTFNTSSSAIGVPQLGEAYGIFVNTAGAIYGGSQDSEESGNVDICTLPENVLSCALGLDTCPVECISVPTSTGNCDVSEKSVEFSNGVTALVTIKNTWTNLRNLHTVLNTWEISNLRCDLMTPDSQLKTISSCNGNFTYDGNTTGNIKIWIRYNEVAPTSREGKPNNNSERTYPQWTYNFGNLESCTTPVICTTPENVLACNLGLDTCPVECQEANIQMINSSTGSKNVQRGDRNLKLADLKFSTTTDVISKISSFRADLSGTNMYNFQGGTVTVYDAAGTALVSQTITSGTSQLAFVLPNTVNVSKTAPAIFTLKLDQVANAVATWDILQLLFSTWGVVARNFITNNSIYPTSSAVSSVLTVVDVATVTQVAQSFTPRLVQLDGTTVSLGSVKFTPYNGNAYLKNMYISLTGSNTAMYTELTLKDSGTVVATFLDDGNSPYFTNLSAPVIAAGTTKTYDLVATLKTATTAANLSTGFKISLTSAGFESANGIAITGTVASNPVLSSVIEFVKAKPTISYVTSTKGGNAVYKFRVAANGGDIKVDALSLTISNNTSMATSTGKLYLTQEGGTELGSDVTVTSGATSPSFTSLSGTVNITNGSYADFVLVFPVSTWFAGTVAGNIGIEVANISYYDTFTDGTTTAHANMFGSYKRDIAPISTFFTLQ